MVVVAAILASGTWTVAYLALVRVTRLPVVHYLVLMLVTLVGAAVWTSVFALEDPRYVFVAAVPAMLTVASTVRLGLTSPSRD